MPRRSARPRPDRAVDLIAHTRACPICSGPLWSAALRRAVRPDELHESERELVRKLLAFPNEVNEAVERRAPHRIATYALEFGQAFAAFYRDSPVLKEPDEALRAFRIALCVASRRTLASSLMLLGVSAPESM